MQPGIPLDHFAIQAMHLTSTRHTIADDAFVRPEVLRWPRKARRALLLQATSSPIQHLKNENQLLQSIVELLFNIPPVWEFAKQKV